MKDFKFRLSRTAVLLSALAILLSLGGAGWTAYRIVKLGFPSFAIGLQHAVMLLVCALLLVIFVSLLARSYYRVTDREIVLRFGIIKSTYRICDVESVHLFTKTNKLVVYFKDETYTVIVVKPQWHEEFIKCLTSKNDKIRYDASYEENEDGEP